MNRHTGEALVLAAVILVVAAQPSTALKPLGEYPAIPSDYGILYERVEIRTADDLRLAGWFYPAQDTAGIANDIVGRRIPVPDELKPAPRTMPEAAPRRGPTVIICDGDGGNMSFAIFYAYQFFTRGFHALTFDWRGFGESDPWEMDQNQLSYTEFLTDYRAAISFAKGLPAVDSTRIGLLGFSTGAYLSFAMVASTDDIAAFAGRALLTSFDDVLPILAELDPDRGFHAPPDYPEELEPIHAAPRVKTPVLLIVGEKDERTPPWMSERVHEKLAGPKELWIVPGATHGGASGPELTDYPAFFVRVAEFFKDHLMKGMH